MKKFALLCATVAALLSVGMYGASWAAPSAQAATNPCPASNSLANFVSADNVGATYSDVGTTRTYRFVSIGNENPVGGVPGLIRYCVYTDTQPSSVTTLAQGGNGAAWVGTITSKGFVFSRPAGNSSNIPLDGTSTNVGFANFSSLPTSQTILLHINDPEVCAALYGATTGTCFVKPSTGPVCNAGLTTPAYNAMPTGVVDCVNPALGFEATATSEFGDEVLLSDTAPRTLSELQVAFASYGCSVSGHWNTGDCVTTPGATFTHSITASIYGASIGGVPGALLARVTQDQVILFRPSADSVNCTGTDAGKWFNPAGPSGGVCQNSIIEVLTFTFPSGITLPNQVIWTVAFNTTHYGYTPIGQGAACFSSAGGCGYDSLNVADKTYPGAPYAGTDVDPNGAFLNSKSATEYCDGGAGGTGFLRLDTATTGCWADYKPLGRIITTA